MTGPVWEELRGRPATVRAWHGTSSAAWDAAAATGVLRVPYLAATPQLAE